MIRPIQLLVISSIFALVSPIAQSQRQGKGIGPYRVGMSVGELRGVAAAQGLTELRLGPEEDRDMMGLGVMRVQVAVAQSRVSRPNGESVWQLSAYFVSGNAAFIDVDYGLDSLQRREKWLKRYDAPAEVKDAVQDTTWHEGGAVFHVDRNGRSMSVVDHQGLAQSNRIMVSATGAVRVANEYFRRALAREAETSVDYLREIVTVHFARQRPGDGADGCEPIAPTDYTPGDTVCTLPEKRFPIAAEEFRQGVWAYLGVDPTRLSRLYSYVIESSGTGRRSRVLIAAIGDLDCDDVVSTIRIALRPARDAESGECKLDSGEWENFDLFE